MYPLFESIRIENGIAMNLEYHQERIAQNTDLTLYSYVSGITLPKDGVYKLRITYIKEKFTGFTLSSYTPKRVKTLKLVCDDMIDYGVKSENRLSLDQLFELRGACDDILIVKSGKITDTSFCNILFYDGSRWVTPSSPLLRGTCRARLINNGIILPIDITSQELKKFQKFMLINALLDFDESRAEELELLL